MPEIKDLTMTMRNQMPVYPGDEPILLVQTSQFRESGYSDFELQTGMHSGTHIDGPMHMSDSAAFLSDLPASAFTGPGVLLDVRNESVIDIKPGYENRITSGCIVLFLTGWDRHFGKDLYFTGHPVLTEKLAVFLIRKKIKMIGLDCPSPDQSPFPIHKVLLDQQILIVENLTGLETLIGIHPFDIFALPVKTKSDSAPARVIAVLLNLPIVFLKKRNYNT